MHGTWEERGLLQGWGWDWGKQSYCDDYLLGAREDFGFSRQRRRKIFGQGSERVVSSTSDSSSISSASGRVGMCDKGTRHGRRIQLAESQV